MSNHEFTQILYDGLGLQDRYLLDGASGHTFMRKYEDDGIELKKAVVYNSHHSAAKPFERGVTPKGQLIDAKLVETGLLLERIKKMEKVHNLLLDQLNIQNYSKGLTPVMLQYASPNANFSSSIMSS